MGGPGSKITQRGQVRLGSALRRRCLWRSPTPAQTPPGAKEPLPVPEPHVLPRHPGGGAHPTSCLAGRDEGVRLCTKHPDVSGEAPARACTYTHPGEGVPSLGPHHDPPHPWHPGVGGDAHAVTARVTPSETGSRGLLGGVPTVLLSQSLSPGSQNLRGLGLLGGVCSVHWVTGA